MAVVNDGDGRVAQPRSPNSGPKAPLLRHLPGRITGIYRQEREPGDKTFRLLIGKAFPGLLPRGEMLRQIVIETETLGNSRTMFRLRINSNVIAEGLTAAQAHLLVGEILDRFTLPKQDERSVRSPPSRWRGFGVNTENAP